MRCIYFSVILSLALPLGLARSNDATAPNEQLAATVTADVSDQSPPGPGSLAWHGVTHRVREGDTFAGILRSLGVAGAEGHFWFQAVNKQLPKVKLTSDQTLYLYFEEPPATQKTKNLRAIQIEQKPAQLLSWTLADQRITFSRRKQARPATALRGEAARRQKAQETPAKTPTTTVAPRFEKASKNHLASVERVTHIIRRGETLAKVFRRTSVPTKEAYQWFRAVTRKYSVKRLRAGRRVVFYFTTSIAPNKASRGKQTLHGLQIETGRGKLLTWQREGKQIAYRGRNYKLADARVTAANSGTPRQAAKPAARTSAGGHRLNGHSTALPAAPPLTSLHRVNRRLAAGKTFAAVVKPLGVSGAESQTWFLAFKKHPAAKMLTAGQEVRLYFEQAPAKNRIGNLRAVQIQSKQGKTLTWRLVGDYIYLGSKQLVALRKVEADDGPKRTIGRYPGGMRKLPLSEYTLARVRQRNGLSAHINPQTGHRPTASLEALERVTKEIKAGNTLLGLLKPYGLNKDDQQLWLSAIQRNYVAKKLRAKSTVHIYFAKTDPIEEVTSPFGALKAFEIELPGNKILTWYRSEQGILFYRNEPPYDIEIKAVAGEITGGSLYDAAGRVGLHPAVVTQLVDIFGWDLNFETDLRKGDTFRVLYTRKFLPGSKKPSEIRVLAAEVVNKGETHVAIYFENVNGTGHYYDLNGQTVSRSFLRYPVEFQRISSSFSRRRYHPILRRRRPHRGVDFAAKRRTPVRTIGSGVVTYAGWKGAYGRFIEIDHGHGLKTRYAHLHRYARGIRPGARVYKGQIIGKVGCSGRCTGPHLHFEMWKNDHYVNPLKTELPPNDELDPTVFKLFQEAKASFLTKLTAEH